MNAKTLSWGAALVLLTAMPVHAEDPLFDVCDLSLDLFGFNASRDKGGADKEAWGLGVGVNYFLTENWGVGADTYADAFTLPYLANGSLLFRYPLGDSMFAPYAFGGFGRQWAHAAQWTGHVGGGLEFRFSGPTALFADVRWVFAEETKDYSVVRFGLRFRL